MGFQTLNAKSEHPRLAHARALAAQTPTYDTFLQIVSILWANPKHDHLPDWPNEATLRDAVNEIDALLDRTWPWETRERFDAALYDHNSEKVHPASRLIRKLVLNRFESRRAEPLLRSLEFSQLIALHMARHEDYVYLSSKRHLRSLQALSLSDVPIKDDEWPAMFAAEHLGNLQFLRLVEYMFDEPTLRQLLTSTMTRSVTALSLCSGSLSGSQLPVLLEHRSLCTRLHTLDLNGNNYHGWDVRPLIEAHWLTNLRVLDLRCRNLDYIDQETQNALKNAPQFANTNILFDPPRTKNARY